MTLIAEADIQTSDAARYLARLCGHAGKMSSAGRHRRPFRGGGHASPEVQHVECSGTEGTVRLNLGQWTMRAFPDRLAIRAEAADRESLQRIQDLLTARLQNFGRREHLTVTWPDQVKDLEPPRPADRTSPTSTPGAGPGRTPAER